MAKLIVTDSYFNMFSVLTEELKGSVNTLSGRNLVFCEEKVSLMVERKICSEFNGSFNTDVYSFGNFLRAKMPMEKLLSKEGSAMAVKRILGSVELKCFRANKINLAPTLFELIIQLKSAKVSPDDLLKAIGGAKGILKSKLEDVYAVYSEYESFIKQNGFEDQSSFLSYLPELLNNSQDVANANVYLVGFEGWTCQIRSAISVLLKKAKSVTAILTGGDNEWLYVNETAKSFESLCHGASVPVYTKKVDGGLTEEGKIIASRLFNPSGAKALVPNNDKIHYGVFLDTFKETERVAEVIKQRVLGGGYRYRDFTVAVPETSTYRDQIKEIFTELKIPFFLDEQKKVLSHPLVTLILAYADCIKKGFERNALLSFVKNPLFCEDKHLTDIFENYLIKYNINYGKIKEPFTFDAIEDIELSRLEELRVKVVEIMASFNVRKLLNELEVERKLADFSTALHNAGEIDESAVNEQIFGAVIKILSEIDMMLGDAKLTVTEFVNVFVSGAQALELSIIPQYNDAVFIGAYKECSLVQAKIVFALGLTASVPNVKADVALLSDGDIDALENLKLLIEPKIRVVNHRVRENVGMALSAFLEHLYLSYPVATVSGKKQEKSEVITTLERLFKFLPFPERSGYLTERQGLKTFATEIGGFAEGETDDISIACSYFNTVGENKVKSLLDNANKDVKERLDGNRSALIGGETAPTVIEDYYKCPYRAFISHVLKLKDREEGVVNALSVGNFMHDILKNFIDDIDSVSDESDCNRLFDQIKNKILSMPVYARFYSDKATATTMNRVIEECRKYCLKTYSYTVNSAFKESKTEQAFGEGKFFPPVRLLNGKVKLCGKIDRVDLSDKYFRVVDYKTGETDISDESLFTGNKLQLYLYAQAVKQKYTDGSKKIAGLYYLPISDKYEKQEDKVEFLADGRTLDEVDALNAQGESFVPTTKTGKLKNGASQDLLDKYVEYAVAVCEKAVERMEEGVIIPSPYKGVCEYCQYGAFCSFNGDQRSIGKVTEQTIANAKKGGDDDAVNG
ncbi:MAG: PD-(D/E)XK nuclease family protein [Clostridia bacterium]|nr:PD-(D/E)XK nuclease family protein [Clostridia bacterium]